jgi:hypothetical protein
MPRHHRSTRQAARTALSEQLVAVLRDRDHGLLTQTEYEDQLSDLGRQLGSGQVLEEEETRGGRICIRLRSSLTREVLDRFEFQRSWSAER